MMDTETFLKNNLLLMGAPLKTSTVFGPAGKWKYKNTGERVVLAPDGVTKLRVVQYVDGGTAVEFGSDRRFAVARPNPHIVKFLQK
jgi:hypothetical protein